jgi:peptide/nickel transport system substrate-binding protein
MAGGLMVLTLLAACGGESKDANGNNDKGGTRSEKGESGLADAGDPVRGGRIVYGLEAESAGGWCLPESQLAISGNLVRRALYDTLIMIDENQVAKPFLAKSIEPNADFTTWTIVVRDGVTFHDGSKLDATVVKNNLDAYRGTYPTRKPRLTVFTLKNIDTVTVTGPMTVEVKTKTPWVNMPFSLQIMGIMGQSQLDDTETCASKMVGTGPFKLSEWAVDQKLVAQRNADYWQIAPDGKPYPYADAIEFRPIVQTVQRINALESGEIDAMMTPSPSDIAGTLTDLRNSGDINMLVSEDHAEVSYLMLNSGQAPFNDPNVRKAMAMGIDREEVNELAADGFPTIADQPFPPGDPGYVDDAGFPEYDPDAAKALIDNYVAAGGSAAVGLTVQSDPVNLLRAEVIQNQLSKIGMDVTLATVDQTTLVNQAIAGEYQAMSWRGQPGGEPDFHYIWWYGVDNPINFARIKDPAIDMALDAGRVEPDADKRRAIYEQIATQFGKEVWNVWLSYVPWAVALNKNVHGVLNMELPDDGGKVTTGLADGHPLVGLWKDEA